MKKTMKKTFVSILTATAVTLSIVPLGASAKASSTESVSSEIAVTTSVTTTPAYIPDELETETTIAINVPDYEESEELNEICEKLRRDVFDSASVFVAPKEGFVIFSSENQEDLDRAKDYCEENGIDLKLVYFTFIQPENDISVTTTTTADINHTTETTTVTTLPDDTLVIEDEEDTKEYYFNIQVVDKDTREKIDNVKLVLDRQSVVYDDEGHENLIGERKTVANWNTSYVNPYISETYVRDDENKVRYFLTSEKLPYNYKFYSSDIIETGASGYFSGEFKLIIELEKSTKDEINVPLSGEYSVQIDVKDMASGTDVENMECELFEYFTGEVVATWNTSEEPVKVVDNLKYSFDSKDSDSGNIMYCIRIKNMPDNYVFYYGKSREYYGVCGFGLIEFAKGTENIKHTVYLEDTSDDAPKVPVVTSSVGDTTNTDTTVTTTVSSDNSTTTPVTTTVLSDNSTTSPTTATTGNVNDELPQTGMPYARAVEGIAILLTLGGLALIVKSRKENNET